MLKNLLFVIVVVLMSTTIKSNAQTKLCPKCAGGIPESPESLRARFMKDQHAYLIAALTDPTLLNGPASEYFALGREIMNKYGHPVPADYSNARFIDSLFGPLTQWVSYDEMIRLTRCKDPGNIQNFFWNDRQANTQNFEPLTASTTRLTDKYAVRPIPNAPGYYYVVMKGPCGNWQYLEEAIGYIPLPVQPMAVAPQIVNNYYLSDNSITTASASTHIEEHNEDNTSFQITDVTPAPCQQQQQMYAAPMYAQTLPAGCIPDGRRRWNADFSCYFEWGGNQWQRYPSGMNGIYPPREGGLVQNNYSYPSVNNSMVDNSPPIGGTATIPAGHPSKVSNGFPEHR